MTPTRNGSNHLALLQEGDNCGKINQRRKLEIFSQLIRHTTAIIYLVAELVIGEKPERL